MNLSRCMVTTSQPTVTRSIWLETWTQYLHDIVHAVVSHSIPDELIINADQMSSKYVPTANVTMAEKNSKRVARKGANDKRGITVMLRESLSGEILPMQLIYKGKTNRSLPSVKFPAGFALTYNKKHWGSEKETLNFIQDILCLYIKDVTERLGLDVSQKSLLLWDAFKAQSTNSVIEKLDELNIECVMVPKNMTHLLQPLDLTTNGAMKKMGSRTFSEYFTNCITKELLKDPGKDVTTIDVDLKLSTLKPKHKEVMCNVYNYLKSMKGKNIILSGWKAADITSAINEGRAGVMPTLDLYSEK